MKSSIQLSIILPVYNAAGYLKKCIDSIIVQTFSNFELLIINDGSTDDSENIILSYADDRIIYIKNETNKGLIYALNKGIKEAKGEFIARMDADDVCVKNRLELQVDWLMKNTKTAVVAGLIEFIDSNGNKCGVWSLDQNETTAQQIKTAMISECCIAHPSVMMRSSVIKNYNYSINQKNTEDYALWLELLSDGHIIEKIPETVLYYRIHSNSVTESLNKKRNIFFLNFQTKQKFLSNRLSKSKFSLFEWKIFLSATFNFIAGVGKEIKNIFR